MLQYFSVLYAGHVLEGEWQGIVPRATAGEAQRRRGKRCYD
jgi:hypothetical protein